MDVKLEELEQLRRSIVRADSWVDVKYQLLYVIDLLTENKKAETPKEPQPKIDQYQRYPDGTVGDWYG